MEDEMASEGKHTPGPWHFRKSMSASDGAHDFGIGADVSGRPQCIAEAFGRSSETDFLPAEANARLMAACPEMLAYCKLMEANGDPDAAELVAKAEGRS